MYYTCSYFLFQIYMLWHTESKIISGSQENSLYLSFILGSILPEQFQVLFFFKTLQYPRFMADDGTAFVKG